MRAALAVGAVDAVVGPTGNDLVPLAADAARAARHDQGDRGGRYRTAWSPRGHPPHAGWAGDAASEVPHRQCREGDQQEDGRDDDNPRSVRGALRRSFPTLRCPVRYANGAAAVAAGPTLLVADPEPTPEAIAQVAIQGARKSVPLWSTSRQPFGVSARIGGDGEGLCGLSRDWLLAQTSATTGRSLTPPRRSSGRSPPRG